MSASSERSRSRVKSRAVGRAMLGKGVATMSSAECLFSYLNNSTFVGGAQGPADKVVLSSNCATTRNGIRNHCGWGFIGRQLHVEGELLEITGRRFGLGRLTRQWPR